MTSTGDAREVGWYSWDEWHYVRKLLYSFDDTSSQIKGVNMVRVWKSRLSQRVLPVSVDLTAALVAASIGNKTCVAGNEYQAQMSSAMAIIRFVNGVTDQHQTGLYAQSVQLIADKIDIPDWMVDLRHEATHAKLPGFDLLKSGLVIALNWLDDHYWEETASKLIEKENDFSVGLNTLLREFTDNIVDIVAIDTQKHLKSTKEKNKAKQQKIILNDSAMTSIFKYLNLGNLKHFVSIFLQDGFFILNNKQLDILEVHNVSCALKLELTLLNHINALSDSWKPLFYKLSNEFPPFMHVLVSQMIALAKSHQHSSTHAHYLVAMYMIFKCNNSCSKQFLGYLLKNPSQLSFQIISLFLKKGEFSSETKKKIQLFLGIFEPVLYTLTSRSKPFDYDKLEEMGMEASIKGKQLLDRFKKESAENSISDDNSLDSSWSPIDEQSTLPPLGEFCPTKNLFTLDANYSMMDFSCDSVEDNDIDTESDTMAYGKDIEFEESFDNADVPENMDCNQVVPASLKGFVQDDIDNVSEEVDFGIQDPAQNASVGSNFIHLPPRSFRDCDVSKICFF